MNEQAPLADAILTGQAPAKRGSRRLSAGIDPVADIPVRATEPAPTPEQWRARGVEEGRAQAHREYEEQAANLQRQAETRQQQLDDRAQALTTAIAAFEALRRDHAEQVEGTLARLTALASGRLLQTLATQEQLAAEIVRSVAARYRDAAGLELALNEQDRAQLPADLQTLVPVIVDPDLHRGEFRVRLPHQQLDVDLLRQYQSLCELLRDDGKNDR